MPSGKIRTFSKDDATSRPINPAWVNAHAAIPNIYAQPTAAATAANHDTAARSVAHGVGYQVERDPFQQYEIAAHTGAIWDHAQAEPLLPRSLRKRCFHALEQALDGKLSQVRREHACIELGHIEERVEQIVYGTDGGVDVLN